MDSDQFVYIWAYRVLPESEADFRDLYGVHGEWVELFRQAPGYLGTELYRDSNQEGRYVTVDRWNSVESYRSFRDEFAEEFARLDSKGDQLTQEEMLLGEFSAD